MSTELITPLELQKVMVAAIAAGALDEVVPEIEHLAASGVYARIMKAPAGSTIIGRAHKAPHICVFLSGSMIVEGGLEVHAPLIFVSEPGQKVATFTSDSVFINFHRINPDEDSAPLEEILPALEERNVEPVLEITYEE